MTRLQKDYNNGIRVLQTRLSQCLPLGRIYGATVRSGRFGFIKDHSCKSGRGNGQGFEAKVS